MLRSILRGDGPQHVMGRLIGLYLGIALRSSRWRIEADPATWALLTCQDRQTAIVVFWHEYLPVVPALWWRGRRDNPSLSLNALISRHRDGRMIAGIMRRWGIGTVDGSSSKAGRRDKGERQPCATCSSCCERVRSSLSRRTDRVDRGA